MVPLNFDALLLFCLNIVCFFTGISQAQVWWNTVGPPTNDTLGCTTPNLLGNATYNPDILQTGFIVVGPYVVPKDKCLVIFHIAPQDDMSLKERVLYIFQTLMELDHLTEDDIESTYRIGEQSDYSVPVFVVLRSAKLKHTLFKNVRKLAGKDYKIGNCLSKEEVRRSRVARQFLIKARMLRKQAKVSGLNLQIDGKNWKLEDLLKNKSPVTFDSATIDQYRQYIKGEIEMI